MRPCAVKRERAGSCGALGGEGEEKEDGRGAKEDLSEGVQYRGELARDSSLLSALELTPSTRLQAAEQLNSWLAGFAPMLRSMRAGGSSLAAYHILQLWIKLTCSLADNFDFLLAVLLRRRFASRAETLEKTHKGVKVG